MLEGGRNPSRVRTAEKRRQRQAHADSFEATARAWLEVQRPALAAKTVDKLTWILEAFLFPEIGRTPVAALNAPEILLALRQIERRQRLDTAHRARQLCSQICRFAIASGLADRDPAADLRGALTPLRTAHRAAFTDPRRVGQLLRAIDGFDGAPVIRYALTLLALTFVRPGELRGARWSEIERDDATWRIPAERMKMKQEHLVPLSRQALEALDQLRLLGGRSKWIFPSVRRSALVLSDGTMNAGLRRLGYGREEFTPHGFRAVARTLLDEALHYPPDVIEVQLAHQVRGPLGATYNRSTYWPQRIEMMQRWADYLDTLRRAEH